MPGKFSPIAVQEVTHRMEVISPHTGTVMKDRNGKAAYIDLYSANSGRTEDTRRDLFDDHQRRKKRNASGEQTYDEAKERRAHFLAQLIDGWYLMDFDGVPFTDVVNNVEVPLPATYEYKMEMLTDPGMQWLIDQIDEAAGKDANFMKKPKRGSASTREDTSAPS